MKNFKVVDFRFASTSDVYDKQYMLPNIWSRPYEYKYVFDFINKNKQKDIKIHNSSWGFEGVHVMFRDMLDTIGDCVHSDIVNSLYRFTTYYNITTENKEYNNNFDFVINVSTIEHLNTPNERITAIENLFHQVKSGGYLILTFDYPSVNLIEIEGLVKSKCVVGTNILNGANSVLPNEIYKNLNIVYLILQKK